MASTGAKAVRRARALSRLDDLAVQLGEKMGVTVPDLRLKGGDPELAQVQQMEATADLLESVLKASGSEELEGAQDARPEGGEADARVEEATATDTPARSTKRAAKKAAKKSGRG